MDIKRYYRGGLYLSGRINIKDLPEGLTVRGHLDITCSSIERLPRGLNVGGDLFMRATKIRELPRDMRVGGKLFLEGSMIENYPLIHNCGIFGRTIYLDLENKSIIHMGCFKGTRNQALMAIANKYKCGEGLVRYQNQVIKCFKLGEEYHGSNKID